MIEVLIILLIGYRNLFAHQQDFVLSAEKTSLAFTASGGPLPKVDCQVIKDAFEERVQGNVCIKRHNPYAEKSSVILYCFICKNDYKLQYLTKDALSGKESNFSVFTRSADMCKETCRKKTIVRGAKRVEMKDRLKLLTPKQIDDEVYSSPHTAETHIPPTMNVLNRVMHDLRADQDLAADVIERSNRTSLKFRSTKPKRALNFV